jgi:hypothetical protein
MINRADARRADAGDTSFVVRQTTQRHKRVVPDQSDLQIRRGGWRALLGRRPARVDSLCELSMTVTTAWKPVENEALQLSLTIGRYGERFDIAGRVARIEPSPGGAPGWRVIIDYVRAPGPLKACLRSI